MGKEKVGCKDVQYFLLRAIVWLPSVQTVLIHMSQGVNTNLYTVGAIFFSFLTLVSVVSSAGDKRSWYPETEM